MIYVLGDLGYSSQANEQNGQVQRAISLMRLIGAKGDCIALVLLGDVCYRGSREEMEYVYYHIIRRFYSVGPIYYTHGNHDRKREGQDDYSVLYFKCPTEVAINNVLLVFLDSSKGVVNDDEIQRARTAMQQTNIPYIYLLTHIPPAYPQWNFHCLHKDDNIRALIREQKEKITGCIYGHIHSLQGPFNCDGVLQYLSGAGGHDSQVRMETEESRNKSIAGYGGILIDEHTGLLTLWGGIKG